MEIQTNSVDGWVTVEEFTDWTKVIKAGWKFVGLDSQKNVIMVRNGYINSFKQVDVE